MNPDAIQIEYPLEKPADGFIELPESVGLPISPRGVRVACDSMTRQQDIARSKTSPTTPQTFLTVHSVGRRFKACHIL